jgi:hypothetical protein
VGDDAIASEHQHAPGMIDLGCVVDRLVIVLAVEQSCSIGWSRSSWGMTS